MRRLLLGLVTLFDVASMACGTRRFALGLALVCCECCLPSRHCRALHVHRTVLTMLVLSTVLASTRAHSRRSRLAAMLGCTFTSAVTARLRVRLQPHCLCCACVLFMLSSSTHCLSPLHGRAALESHSRSSAASHCTRRRSPATVRCTRSPCSHRCPLHRVAGTRFVPRRIRSTQCIVQRDCSAAHCASRAPQALSLHRVAHRLHSAMRRRFASTPIMHFCSTQRHSSHHSVARRAPARFNASASLLLRTLSLTRSITVLLPLAFPMCCACSLLNTVRVHCSIASLTVDQCSSRGLRPVPRIVAASHAAARCARSFLRHSLHAAAGDARSSHANPSSGPSSPMAA